MKTRNSILLAACLAVFVCGTAEGWTKGQISNLGFRGLTGGGGALDGRSGNSIEPYDQAVVQDVTGVTVYWYGVSTTGNESGTTVESSPDWICPDDMQAGATTVASGLTMWRLSALSGTTVWGKVFVVGNRTVIGADVDNWNAAYGWGDHGAAGYLTGNTAPSLPTVMAEIAAGTSTFLTGNTAPSLSTVKNEITSGTSLFALQSALTAHTGANAVSGTSVDWTSGATLPRLSGVTDGVQAQLNTNAGAVPGHEATYNHALYLTAEVDAAALAALTLHTAAGAIAAASMWALPATKAQLDAAGAPGTTSGASLWAGASAFMRSAVSDFHTGTTYNAGVSKQVEWTILNTDQLTAQGVTPVPIWYVNPLQYPNGIAITYLEVDVTSGITTFNLKYERWGNKSYQSVLGEFNCLNGASRYSDSGVTTVEAGKAIYVNPVTTTGTYSIHGSLIFYPR